MENTHWFGIKVNLGDYCTADYGGAGMSAEEAKQRVNEMIEAIPFKVAKKKAIIAKKAAEQEAKEGLSF